MDWKLYKTDHFELYFEDKDHLLANYILKQADKDYKRIIKDIGTDPNVKATVYIAPDRNSYKELQPEKRKTHEWSVGVFYPGLNLILLLSPKVQKTGRPDLQKIMAHEITHFIIHNIIKDKGIELPIWLHEGLAMYEAREWDWRYRRLMTEISLTRSFISLGSLEKDYPKNNKLAERAYAQSISLIAYIINKKGRDSLHRIINNLVKGMSVEDAFKNALNLSVKELEMEWHKYLRRHYTWIPIVTSSFFIWTLITILALLIYFHKKRKAQKTVALWEIEDQINSLFRRH